MFGVNSLLFAVDEKEATVKQTSTDFVLLVVRISFLCVGIAEIDL